ncbi:MAG TPA: zinc-ribbon domain-containing protein, partial [Acidimicrobiia bacterium]
MEPTSYRYCGVCGEPLEPGATVCGNCGAAAEDMGATGAMAAGEPTMTMTGAAAGVGAGSGAAATTRGPAANGA